MKLKTHQQHLLDDKNKYIIAMWSRRSGKTTVAIEMLRNKNQKGTHIFVTPNLKNAIDDFGPKYIKKSKLDYSIMEINKKVTVYIATYEAFIGGIKNADKTSTIQADSIIMEDICQLSENQKALAIQAAEMHSNNASILILTTPPLDFDIICDIWWDNPKWSKHHYAPDIDEEKIDGYKKVIGSARVEADLLAKIPKYGD